MLQFDQFGYYGIICVYRCMFHNFYLSVLWSLRNSRMNTKKKCGIFSELTIEIQERRQCFLMSSSQWGRSGVFFLTWCVTDYTPCSRVFIIDFEQVNTHWIYSDFCVCVHISCQGQIHEPCHIKTEHFVIILNGF